MTSSLTKARAIDLELGSNVASHALAYLGTQKRGAEFGRIHVALRVGVRALRVALDKLEERGLASKRMERGLTVWEVSK